MTRRPLEAAAEPESPAAADPPCCSDAEHAAIRGNALRFLRETKPIGIQPTDEGGLVLATCLRCQSTLARPMPPASPGERLDAAKVCVGCGGRAEHDAMCDACEADVS